MRSLNVSPKAVSWKIDRFAGARHTAAPLALYVLSL
jgi:hypothetical protein